MKLRALAVATVFSLTAGCASSKIRLSEKWNPEAKPSYEDYLDYYFFGLSGDRGISLQKICMDQQPHAVRKLMTAEDILLTTLTFGIYVPVTVRVWCGD
jgi:hypothetical protein